MWELDCKEGWGLKNLSFQNVVWRRLLRVPWTARRSNQSILKKIDAEYSLKFMNELKWRYNQSILKEISPRCSLERLMLKLKLQYFGHLMQRIDSFEKTLMLGKFEGRRRRGQQRMRWLYDITNSMYMGLGELRELVIQGGLTCYGSWGRKESDPTEWLNWTEFIERIDAETEAPILWPPDVKRPLIGKDSDTGNNWRPKEKKVAEDEMVGQHHQLTGHEFVQTQGDRRTEDPGGL